MKISLSTDGGQTFPFVLANSTANDGSEPVTVPNITTEARIKVEAVGNVFFAVNDADFSITEGGPVDPTVPDTAISSAPSKWLLGTAATYVFSSTVGGSTFTCVVDGASAPCTSPKTVTGLSQASHVFTVAATADGQTDASPARSVTTVPLNDTALKIKGKKWTRKKSGGSYLGTYSKTKKKGAKLTYKVAGARSLALIVTTGKNNGKVKVYLNGVLLKKVKLKGSNQKRKVVDLGTLPTATSGKLTIVTQNKKLVRIEGLGVATTL